MSGFDIAIAVVVPVLFLAAVGFMIYRKLKRNGSVGCDCSDCCDCSECSGCRNCEEQKEKPKQ